MSAQPPSISQNKEYRLLSDIVRKIFRQKRIWSFIRQQLPAIIRNIYPPKSGEFRKSPGLSCLAELCKNILNPLLFPEHMVKRQLPPCSVIFCWQETPIRRLPSVPTWINWLPITGSEIPSIFYWKLVSTAIAFIIFFHRFLLF